MTSELLCCAMKIAKVPLGNTVSGSCGGCVGPIKALIAVLLDMRIVWDGEVGLEVFPYQFLDLLLELLVIVGYFRHVKDLMRHAD